MKFRLLALGLAMASLPAFAQEAAHDYGKSVFAKFHTLTPNTRVESASVVQNIQQYFPGMNATVDKLSGNFTDLFGGTVAMPGNTVQDKAQYCIENPLASLGLIPSEWGMISSTSSSRASYVRYTQKINGHAVVFSRLNFRFTQDGKLQRIQMNNYGRPGAQQTPTITQEAALTAALNDLSGIVVEKSSVEPDWYWFPVPTANGYELRPAFAFHIQGKGERLPVDLNGFVDGQSGEVLYRDNEVKQTVTQTVLGNVFKQDPTQPATNEPLANLKITVNGVNYYTDTAGLFSAPSLTLPVTATMNLEGLWSTVRDASNGNLTPQFQNVITTNGGNYIFPASSPSSDRQVNAYYHVNRVHDFMKGYFPSFNQLDYPLPTNVDVAGSCNAFYNGSSINFYTAGNGCNSFAENGDIIYHEYGHAISHNFYASQGVSRMKNGALNEGNSDIWAISITHVPIIGKGSTVSGSVIRRYDLSRKVYPQDIQGEVHADGEIIAGAWWDVATNLNSVDTMTLLFTDTYFDTPDGPNGTEGDVYHQVLISALMNDDNDNNLNNGTPHFQQIVDAFALHGIYLLSDANLTHSEIPHQNPGAPITINANLTVSTPGFLQGLKLYYRVRGQQWDTLNMTNTSGNNYSAQIPAQQEGAMVDYYFGVYDNTGVQNVTFPLNYDPSLALSRLTLPYQFGVGIHPMIVTDFETPVTGWTVGNAPGDNATSGVWIIAVPVGSSVNSASGAIPVQPGYDHTTGSGKCLVTGNASNSWSSIGTADVDGGRTSVITPVFDLTSFVDPVVEYWRWYSNDAGDNPGEDYWSVYIKDVAAPSWIVRVDYTRQSDNRWRRRIFRTKEYLPNSSQLSLKFQAQDIGNPSIVEAAVDDIIIYDKGVVNSTEDVQVAKAVIYPNPANDRIEVRMPSAATGTLILSDITGKEVARHHFEHSNTAVLNTASFPAGTYMITVKTEKMIQVHKVVLAH